MNRRLIGCVLAASLALGTAGPAGAYNFGTVTLNTNVQTLVNGVTQAELQQSVAEISGETTVVVGGVTTMLPTRSAKDPLVARAEQYLYEHLQSYGLSPVYQT